MTEVRVLTLLIAVGLLQSPVPAAAQLSKPQLTAPPCTDPHNCPNYRRGAALLPPGASQRQKVSCPAGTIYNAKRGTCKVVAMP
jgi:hypothetical protein